MPISNAWSNLKMQNDVPGTFGEQTSGMSPNPRTGVLCACVILLVTLSLVCSDHVDDLLAADPTFDIGLSLVSEAADDITHPVATQSPQISSISHIREHSAAYGAARDDHAGVIDKAAARFRKVPLGTASFAPTPLPRAPMELLPGHVPMLLTFPAKFNCLGPGEQQLDHHTGEVRRDFIPIHMVACSRADSKQYFEFEPQWQQIRHQQSGFCMHVEVHADELVLRPCLNVAQTFDPSKLRRQRFIWQRALKTIRSSVAAGKCFIPHANTKMDSKLALGECRMHSDYLGVVTFLPDVVAQLPSFVGIRFKLNPQTSFCLTFTAAAAGHGISSHSEQHRVLEEQNRAHVAVQYRKPDANSPWSRAREHRRLSQRSSTAPSTHRLVDDVALDECRQDVNQRMVYSQRSRQIWAAGTTSLDGLEDIGNNDIHQWLRTEGQLAPRFCLEVDGLDESGVERVAWKHCAAAVGEQLDDGERRRVSDVHRLTNVLMHQQWEWNSQMLRSVSVDKCVAVRGLPGAGQGEYGAFVVGSVVVGDEASMGARWSRALPHVVLVPCHEAPKWHVDLF